jgi:hypothetical protein
MPDVRFDEVIIVKPQGEKKIEVEIDENYLYVCEEGTIKPIGFAPSSPCSCGLRITEGKLKIDIEGEPPEELIVKLSGIRKDFGDKRFEKFSYEEMRANNKFWEQWKKD